jgi:hypothetical protein
MLQSKASRDSDRQLWQQAMDKLLEYSLDPQNRSLMQSELEVMSEGLEAEEVLSDLQQLDPSQALRATLQADQDLTRQNLLLSQSRLWRAAISQFGNL